MTCTEKRSTVTLLHAGSSDGEICKCNAQAAFLERKRTCYMVSMTYCDDSVLDMDQ